jgi:hypothetical protein
VRCPGSAIGPGGIDTLPGSHAGTHPMASENTRMLRTRAKESKTGAAPAGAQEREIAGRLPRER